MTTRVLYLTNQGAMLYLLRGHKLRESVAFGTDAKSLEEFAALLKARPELPTRLLTDLIEEEFRTERLPHTNVTERAPLHARHGQKIFRNTPYHHAALLGRERGGRRDDRLLFSALTHPEVISPWLDRMAATTTNLRAISSVALLSATLPKHLRLRERYLLIATEESSAGLRQSFFADGELQISRLSPASHAGDAGSHASWIISELCRTQQFLQRSLLLPSEALLTIYLVGEEPLLAALRKITTPAGLEIRLMPMAALCRRLHVDYLSSLGSEAIFAQIFAREGRNRYAPPEALRSGAMHTLRTRMQRVGIALSVGLTAGALFNLYSAATDDRAVASARTQLSATQPALLLNAASEEITPQQLRSAVESAERLTATPMHPGLALGIVGRALASFPEFSLQRVQWSASTRSSFREPGAASGGNDNEELAAAPVNAPGSSIYHVVQIEGLVRSRFDDLRQISTRFDSLVAKLNSMPQVADVRVLARPVNLKERLAGSVGEKSVASSNPTFALQVMVVP